MKKTALVLVTVVMLAVLGRIAYRYATAPTPDSYDSRPLPLAEDPRQVALADMPLINKKFDRGTAAITPLASYRIAGKVCGINHLKHSKFVDLIPYDLCLKWGRLATENPRGLKFKHDSLRIVWATLEPGSSVDWSYVSTHFSNSHLICATDSVCAALSRLGKDDEVELTGYLVNALIRIEGTEREWNSSLTRTDTGLGACETIYVVSVRSGGKVYGRRLDD